MNTTDSSAFVALAGGLSIADVARETGLGKDTLRVWERRYGFPQPTRDAQGERLYSQADVERLRLVRRLMLQGHRPGQLVAVPLEQLRQKLPQPASSSLADPHTPGSAGATGLAQAQPLHQALALLERHEVAALRAHLAQTQARLGLGAWVQQLVAPLTQAVGQAWELGRLSIHQEHLYTEVVQDVLRQAIRSLPEPGVATRPRVLLTTLPGETHALGLLMAEAMLALEGAACTSLGVQTPVDELLLAAQIHQIDIVALSATACVPERSLAQALAMLRQRLPEPVALWVGGASLSPRQWPEGCLSVSRLADVAEQVQRWRAGGAAGV